MSVVHDKDDRRKCGCDQAGFPRFVFHKVVSLLVGLPALEATPLIISVPSNILAPGSWNGLVEDTENDARLCAPLHRVTLRIMPGFGTNDCYAESEVKLLDDLP